jgi:pathogenesis-related protein 1
MRAHRLPATLLLATACGIGLDGDPDGGTAGGGGPDAALPAEAQTWLDAHNAVRRDAQPPPTPPLPPLTWSPDAASIAQAWADGCTYQHNSGRGDRGENIAASAPPNRWSIADAIAAWASEAQDYDYARNTCAAGKQCGHYTQIVWRTTRRVGCAHRTCFTGSPFGAQLPSWDYWVCDYEPPGNWVGQRPY